MLPVELWRLILGYADWPTIQAATGVNARLRRIIVETPEVALPAIVDWPEELHIAGPPALRELCVDYGRFKLRRPLPMKRTLLFAAAMLDYHDELYLGGPVTPAMAEAYGRGVVTTEPGAHAHWFRTPAQAREFSDWVTARSQARLQSE
jgi:hypothetical protein